LSTVTVNNTIAFQFSKGARSRNFWAISGNFSSDQIVIELTKISKYRRTLTKHRKSKKGPGWTNLERKQNGTLSAVAIETILAPVSFCQKTI